MGEETTRIREEIESLRQMTTGQFKNKYREVFGEETPEPLHACSGSSSACSMTEWQ